MKHEVATLGGGCFWCLEAVFEETRGVIDVISGYAGGKLPNPTYEAVSSGTTEHAEVVQITYDVSIISYEEILKIFWLIHDPTSLNAQGNDVGTQYRSIIFYHDETQKAKAQNSLKTFSSKFTKPMVTEIKPLEVFYKAEAYHQDYFKNNPNQGYCLFVVSPKVQHFKRELKDLAK
ncbi:peptide-methionine (S)-S-oxide reductase MsrA [Sulfurospirillum deleyianum]|uniref:Peptide methionine sulfoxide reductase MsrA n=1 Tax=Sulfurospirillum deleyianum (strain ATCC 51133 / DSM 6946 / 5175) TaxID=525898 RepID=D1B275_SULD5|nr:peptide-methionine (S)-S-oxide reductase MsrA [Sulfurospirillum deleyianum]ACZ12195.1 peptide methionine sulfoxide reductase [Sulfurospirillum deleyianum DSM 6946]